MELPQASDAYLDVGRPGGLVKGPASRCNGFIHVLSPAIGGDA